MNLTLPSQSQTLTGWGRTMPATCQVVRPAGIEPLRELVRGAGAGSLIPRGWAVPMAMRPNATVPP